MAGLPGRTQQIRAIIVFDTNVLDSREQNVPASTDPAHNHLADGSGAN
jgi:hypothetical protein